jgi:SAM-dependent methyltransferase
MRDNANEYDRIYAKRLYDVRSVYDHIIRIRQRYLDFERGARVLDHGFGNGVISVYLAEEGFEPFGVESSQAAVDLVRARSAALGLKAENFRHIAHASTRMPFGDGEFAAIVSNQVLYFLASRPQIDATVADFFRILRPGGKVACTIMAENNYYFTKCGVPPVAEQGAVKIAVRGRIERDFELYRFHDAGDVRASFERAGFVVDDLGYFDFRLLDVECAKHYIVLARKP